MLYELLDAFGADKVCAISYKYPWLLDSKKRSEEIARDAIKAHLATLGPRFTKFQHVEITVGQKMLSGPFLDTNQAGGLPQALAWLLSVPIYATDGSYIYDGGIRSDDLTLRLEEYHMMFRGVAGVMRKNLTLREPYLYYKKADILAKLITYGLYDITWFCETPNDVSVPCYRCNPCTTHIAALIELSISDNVSELVKKKALFELEKIKTKREEINKILPADDHDVRLYDMKRD